MNEEGKLTFVNQLCMRIALDLGQQIMTGKIPEEWDGHELCALIADKAEDAASMSEVRKEPRKARAKDYRNTVIVNNL